MQDIKRERELRDNGSNANTRISFEVRATALHPRLHTEGLQLSSHRTFHKGTSTEELQLKHWKCTTPLLKHKPLHKREDTKSKERKDYTLGDPMVINNT